MTKRMGLVLAGLFLLASCGGEEAPTSSSPPKSPAPSSPSEPLTIDLKVRGAGDHVWLDGTTNLPDGTLVTVLLHRRVLFKNDGNEARAVHLGGDGVQIENGKLIADMDLDESEVDRAVAGENDDLFGPVTQISSFVGVCAQVRYNDDDEQPQPEDVMEVLGDKGANFASSPQKSSFGDGLRLEVLKPIKLPYVPPGGPNTLKAPQSASLGIADFC